MSVFCKRREMKVFGLGRSRSDKGKGEWTNVHLNPYTNCIHTLVGGGVAYDGRLNNRDI